MFILFEEFQTQKVLIFYLLYMKHPHLITTKITPRIINYSNSFTDKILGLRI